LQLHEARLVVCCIPISASLSKKRRCIPIEEEPLQLRHSTPISQLHEARLVVCCIPTALDRCVNLADELRLHGVPLIAVADSNRHARRLYRHGARFVVQVRERER
jgi:3-dehydroquinate dehydratase